MGETLSCRAEFAPQSFLRVAPSLPPFVPLVSRLTVLRSYLSLLSFLLEFPLLLLFLLDSRFDLRERLPRERAKCRTVLLGLAGRKEGKSSRGIEGGEVQLFQSITVTLLLQSWNAFNS